MHGYQTSNNGIKESTHGCEYCITSHILIFGGYVKGRESLYFQVVIWVHIILNHIDTRIFLPRYKGSCMYINLSALKTKNTCLIFSKIHIPYWFLENVKSSLQMPGLYIKRITPVQYWLRLHHPFTNWVLKWPSTLAGGFDPVLD